jgi:hypothetical protein
MTATNNYWLFASPIHARNLGTINLLCVVYNLNPQIGVHYEHPDAENI